MAERSSERGVIVIVVAVMLLALMVVVGLVIDHGILMTSRAQAQNAADAAALSGALARTYVDQSNPPASKTSGKIWERTVKVAEQNAIWGVSPPSSSVTLDWTCPDGTTECVVVDVFRDGTHGSTTLPTVFLNLVGLDEQHIRAHAVADTTGGNATDCMRPWFLVDAYDDRNGNDTYDAGDVYVSPGYRVPEDLGRVVTFHKNGSPSGYGQIDVGSGGSDIRNAIKYCASGTYTINQPVRTEPGNVVGPNRQGVDDLLDWDPNASYDPTTKTIINSCAPNSCYCDGPACPYGGEISPRVVIVPICSPLEASCAAGGPSGSLITITNFLSFLILGHTGNGSDFNIQAQLVGTAGLKVSGAPTAPENGAFTKVIRLIR